MKATALEFRLRMAIMTAVITLGFWAPWIEAWGIGRRISLLEWLALQISRLGLATFNLATPAIIVFASLVAAIGAVFRVWGTAWIGHETMRHAQMQAGAVQAGGPYRHVRNPLYLGSWCMFAAMAFLMPASGAVFAMVLLTVLLYRLILGEEEFLAARLGEPYQEYRRAVPRLIPRLHAGLPPTAAKPRWIVAALSELNPIGVFLILACLSWSYDYWLMVKAIVVSLGVSLVVRAFLPRGQQDPTLPA
jgi:protein-S-isoprenylcysteine O-methyltransferase Ste14